MSRADAGVQGPTGSVMTADEQIKQVVDALCAEFGVSAEARWRRETIEKRVARAYSDGRRQPLDLVEAGLRALQ
jgi:hypothetical protein